MACEQRRSGAGFPRRGGRLLFAGLMLGGLGYRAFEVATAAWDNSPPAEIECAGSVITCMDAIARKACGEAVREGGHSVRVSRSSAAPPPPALVVTYFFDVACDPSNSPPDASEVSI